jgi:small subunit ribosomal protein S20
MANTSSAKKAIRVQERKRARNQKIRSLIKTVQKDALEKIKTSSTDAHKAVIRAISQIDKASTKGTIHKNKAARKKSRLMRQLNTAANPKTS